MKNKIINSKLIFDYSNYFYLKEKEKMNQYKFEDKFLDFVSEVLKDEEEINKKNEEIFEEKKLEEHKTIDLMDYKKIFGKNNF